MENLIDIYNQTPLQIIFCVVVYHIIWLYIIIRIAAIRAGRAFKFALEVLRKDFIRQMAEKDAEIDRLKRLSRTLC